MLITKFYSELELTRRARISGRETSVRDPPKRRAAYYPTGLSKASVIENIKHLGAKLQVGTFVESGVLDYREIDIIKAGTDYHVASQVSESSDRRKR